MKYIETNISPFLWEALNHGDIEPSADCITNSQHYHALVFIGAANGQIYASIFPKAFNSEMVALVEKSLGFLNTIRNNKGADLCGANFEAQMGFSLAEKALVKIIEMFPIIEIGAVNSPFSTNELPMLYSF
jgi:hypothetical protein